MSHQPIFILASPRSFTSLLCIMLGQHPEVYVVPELHLFLAKNMAQWLQQLKQYPRKIRGYCVPLANWMQGNKVCRLLQWRGGG